MSLLLRMLTKALRRKRLIEEEVDGEIDTAPNSIKVHIDDRNFREINVTKDMTVAEVCATLTERTNASYSQNWVLVEELPSLGLRRILEDSECDLDSPSDRHFRFMKNYSKYLMFSKPEQYFPVGRFDKRRSHAAQRPNRGDRALHRWQRTGKQPDVEGFLRVLEGSEQHWRLKYCLLRPSGFYLTDSAENLEPHLLQLVTLLEEPDACVYMTISKIYHNAEHVFCIRSTRSNELLCFSADTEQLKSKWMSALRIRLFGRVLHTNYRHSVSLPSSCQSLVSQNENLAGIDFTGTEAVVLDDPASMLSIAVEEGLRWKSSHSSTPVSTPGNSPPRSNSLLERFVHVSQPWFFHSTDRQTAERLLYEQGLTDGLFLIRTTHLKSADFALSLVMDGTILHYNIYHIKAADGSFSFSIDDGVTIFADLTQLVDFHRLNTGPLPVRLVHHVVKPL